jgi:hypothetical protein
VSVRHDEVFAEFLHGQTGMAADIVDEVGSLLLRQSPADTQRVRCGVFLRLSPAQRMGWLNATGFSGLGVSVWSCFW